MTNADYIWNHQGTGIDKLAEKLGISAREVKREYTKALHEQRPIVKRRGPPTLFTPEEDARILRMKGEGQTFREIGAELGRDCDTIRRRHRRITGGGTKEIKGEKNIAT